MLDHGYGTAGWPLQEAGWWLAFYRMDPTALSNPKMTQPLGGAPNPCLEAPNHMQSDSNQAPTVVYTVE